MKILQRAGQILLPLLLIGAAVFFARFVHRFYPIQQWLFWRYAGYWLLCIVWSAACVSAGHLTLKLVLRRTLPLVEHLCTCFAVGAFEWFLAINVAGFLQLYRPPLFVALPLIFLGAGFVPLRRYLTRAYRHLRHARRRAAPAPLWTWAVLAFGLVGAAMVYFLILTPDNIQFDSRWKHLALAEEYVVSGGIRRFPEGNTVATYPHLATFIYTWAFLLPGGQLFDKVELGAHMEYFGFLWTLAAIPAAVRLMLPGALRPRYLHITWAARFLFPGVFLYDSSLSGGADHIAAIFALPTFTLLIRAFRELSPGYLALMIMTAAGGGLTKYTGAIIMVPFPALAIAVRAAMLGYRSLRGKATPVERRNWWLGPLTAVGVGLLITAPHWAKNLVYYTDPLYPTLYKHVASRPWTQDAADLYEWGYKDAQFWRPERSLKGVKTTLLALLDFSFVPNDYKTYHGDRPTFGSLFTLLLLCLPFLRGTKRLWALIGYAHLGIATWYWTHHQDRYLQAILPLMAAATAAMITLVWKAGAGSKIAALATRCAAGALIALQVIWGGDVYFIPTHAMIRSPLKAVLDLLNAGYQKKYTERFNVYPGFQSMARALPARSRVLLHDNHVHLGIGAETVSDWGGWQFGISYGRLRSPRETWDLLRGMGVTHVAWEHQLSKGWDSVAGDLVFFDFVQRNTQKKAKHGSMWLAEMGPAPPPEMPFTGPVAWLGCNDKQSYRNGLYEVSDLTVPVFGPRANTYPPPRHPGPSGKNGEGGGGATAEQLVRAAAFVVLDERCVKTLPAGTTSDFTLAAKRKERRIKGGVRDLYLRTAGAPAPLGSTPAPAPAPEPTQPEPPEAAPAQPPSPDEGEGEAPGEQD